MLLPRLLAATTALATHAGAQNNMLRFACSQLVVDRIDPLVNPGMRYTPHLHQIVGGDSFNVTMEPVAHDLAARSSCTSCSFREDLSNYWTAVLFFQHRNGSFRRVPQVGNGGPQGRLVNDGGLDVYYMPSGKVTAFKKGFRVRCVLCFVWCLVFGVWWIQGVVDLGHGFVQLANLMRQRCWWVTPARPTPAGFPRQTSATG